VDTGTAGQPKHFLQPCLLLLLQEQPDYGYDLVARLRALGVEDDSGTVYRTLRALERDGAVVSRWKAPVAGPARRMYDITSAGIEQLDGWARALDETRKALDGFLTRYERARPGAAAPPLAQEAQPTNGRRPPTRRSGAAR
jgi:poly-beta-hydroxybutyrate-responsive repressor